MMSDPLAAINVDQLSNAVSAVVNAAPGHSISNPNGSVSQSTMGLQMPATVPASIQNTVTVQVDRQFLSQLALPQPAPASESAAIDGPLLHHSGNISGAYHMCTSHQQSRPVQPVLHVSTASLPVGPQQSTQLMAHPANTVPNAGTARQLPAANTATTTNIALMNAVQMLNAASASAGVAPVPAAPQPAPQLLGGSMVLPSILTSVVPGGGAGGPQSGLLGSQLVLPREAGGAPRSAVLAKPGREPMVFNLQPEPARPAGAATNNSVLQLVPISNSNSGLATQQPVSQNPMINMSIAIHLPTHGGQGNKDTTSDMKQARTIPLSQLMTGQPIPVSQITGPLQLGLEPGLERAPVQSGHPVLSATSLGNNGSSSSNSSSQDAVAQLSGNLAVDQSQSQAVGGGAIPSQISIPLSQLTLTHAIPVSQIAGQITDSACLQIAGQQQHQQHQHQHQHHQHQQQQVPALPQSNSGLQLPQSILQSFSAGPAMSGAGAYVASTPPAAATTVTAATSVPPLPAQAQAQAQAQAPVVIMGPEVPGKSYWNIQSLDGGPQLTADLTSQLATSLASQAALEVAAAAAAAAVAAPTLPGGSKTRRPAEMDLGMVSLSPDGGLVSGMNGEDMAALDLGANESIENLAMPFEEEASNIWCFDCNHYNPAACTIHGPPTVIPDALIPCRAKLSLPPMLKLAESLSKRKRIRCGVIATQDIQPRCQFGPLVGRVINKSNDVMDTDSNRVWKVFRSGIVSHFIDISDEDQSNWMRYVRLAGKTQDQNLVAHQSGGSIYFTSNKLIAAGDELKAWYSQDYAQWQGVPEEPGASFHCTQCPMQFLQRRQLAHHLSFKHPDMASRRFKCSVCPRAFISNTKLQLHTLTHMGLKPYKCGHCAKQFSDPSNLRIHTRIHTEEKKFICDICQKPFRQKIHLISHMTTHTGEKHLKCPHCELTFATHSTLRQHKFTHDSDNEAQCEKCGRRFKTHQMLQKHIKTHSWKRDFKCLSCGKAFYTAYHAKRHHQNCRGPRDERAEKKQQRQRPERREGWSGDGKARRQRGRPAARQPPRNKPAEDPDSGRAYAPGAAGSSAGSHPHWGMTVAEHFEGPRLSSRGQGGGATIRALPRLPAGDHQRELPRRASKSDADRPAKEASGIRPAPCFFADCDDDDVIYSPGAREREASSRVCSSSEVASTSAFSSSQGKRHDGRPVRRRKMPKRYAPDEDQTAERKARDGKQGRGESPGIYIFNIVEAGSQPQVPAAGKAQGGQSGQSPSGDAGDSPTDFCPTGDGGFGASPTLGSTLLDDNADSRGSVSAAFSELMGGDDLQNAGWEASIGVSSLGNPVRPLTEPPPPEASGSLSTIAARSSALEPVTSPPSAAISQSLDVGAHLDMPGALFSARSASPIATRSLTLQMRREGGGDIETNDQCDDEARAGTVNDNVEE